jgi:hypothetical protein
MLSTENVVPDDKGIAAPFPPHVMFYAPYLLLTGSTPTNDRRYISVNDFIVYGVVNNPHVQSPYVRSTALGLEEKGANWRVGILGPSGIKSTSYLKLNPFGRVPSLVHGDFELYETQAILRYLDRTISEPSLTPEDPRTEARMNQLCGIADCYVSAAQPFR